MIKKVTMITAILAIIGVSMAYTALVLDVTKLKSLHEEFYEDYGGDLSDPKAREIKAEIENTKPLMLTLKLAGVATILTGITISLLGILRMLSLMPIGLGDVLRANLEDMGLGKEKGK
jgi:hypothetical protein